MNIQRLFAYGVYGNFDIFKSYSMLLRLYTYFFSVTCNDKFLVPSCSDYCVDTNNATGHYKCNYINGTRECLAGWYGPNCLKPKLSCTPRDDNLGHYSCDPSTGEKRCLPGWMDPSTDCIKGMTTNVNIYLWELTHINGFSPIKSGNLQLLDTKLADLSPSLNFVHAQIDDWLSIVMVVNN